MNLRDYIYFDWTRIRSLVGQLGIEMPPADAHAIPGQRGREQQSIYAKVEDALRESSKVLRIDETFNFTDEWSQTSFYDGQLILTSGVFRVLDYEYTSQFLAATPELMRTAYHMANWSAAKDAVTHGQKKHLEEQRMDQQRQISDMKSLKLDQFSEFVKEVFGSGVRIKVMPDTQHTRHVLVGVAGKENFTEPPSGLAEKYGYHIDAGWQVLGQLNILTTHHETLPMATGNNILDNFENMALHVNSIFRVASAPVFPALSFTPICIYRNC